MRLRVLSDLHLEFGARYLPEVDADCVLLAGDIATGLRGIDFARRGFSSAPVLYIAGNHEFYGENLSQMTGQLRLAAEGTNVMFLENDQVLLGGIRFLACTLWTDFRLMGEDRRHLAFIEASARLNDYARIAYGPESQRLRPWDTAAIHAQSRSWLAARLAEPFSGPTVVMTHHAPTIRSLRGERVPNLVDAAFASDVEDLMDADHVRLWIHGHTHHCVDFTIRGTRVLSNAAGYPGETTTGVRMDLVIEL